MEDNWRNAKGQTILYIIQCIFALFCILCLIISRVYTSTPYIISFMINDSNFYFNWHLQFTWKRSWWVYLGLINYFECNYSPLNSIFEYLMIFYFASRFVHKKLTYSFHYQAEVYFKIEVASAMPYIKYDSRLLIHILANPITRQYILDDFSVMECVTCSQVGPRG